MSPPPRPAMELVVAAHPDDETAGLGGWLAARARRRVIHVCFLTDGAPRAARYRSATPAGGRAGYARLRRVEARSAARALGLDPRRLHFAPFADQELHRSLSPAADWLAALAARLRPIRVWAPAYEGGHPDHDAANFLVARVLAACRRWEYALYGACGRQIRFLDPTGAGWRRRRLSGTTRAAKRRALACYRSQALTLMPFDRAAEFVRQQPRHDYTRPATSGPPVWRLWGWPIAAAAPCRAFSSWRSDA